MSEKMNYPILVFIYTNLGNGTTPWNITVPANPQNFPNIILVNMPWLFPLITFFLTGISYYVLVRDTNIEGRTLLLGVTFAYTVLSYVEVLGSLSDIGWFFTFEMLTITMLFVTTLFVSRGEP